MTAPIHFRPGTLEDSYGTFLVLEEAIADLLPRLGITDPTSLADPAELEKMWQRRRSLLEHLTRTAYQFWVAEQAGEVIGFARSTLHDGVLELTEFFVRPGAQSGGVGRQLFERAFPQGDFKHRVIIATTDLRAQARYLKSGVYPRFPLMYFDKAPDPVTVVTDLVFQPMTATPDLFEELNKIDAQILGFRRAADHRWLLGDRQGWLYVREGRPVGYGYTGRNNGPFALLDPGDYPAVLSHMENQASQTGLERVGVEVPLHNRHAVDYLLACGFKIPDGFFAFFMSDAPFGKFEQYIVTSPPFFM
ncbi:MAG: GNAT family N-acetyltransferase [Anaerolineales bacterium]|nr:GNAT family N-acetyltransferase [Anaerolineales bacterium]